MTENKTREVLTTSNMTHENQAVHTLAAYMLRHTRHKGLHSRVHISLELGDLLNLGGRL